MRTTMVIMVLGLLVCSQASASAKRLNNLVTELLDVRLPKAGRAYRFVLPRPGRVWVRLDSRLFAYGVVKVRVDGRQPVVVGDARRHPHFQFDLPEAMLRVNKGEHTVEVTASGLCELTRLRVHAVPEIAVYVYVEDPIYLYGRDSYTAFRWEWAVRNGLLNYNTIVTMRPMDAAARERWESHLRWWRRRGRTVVFNTGICGDHKRPEPAPSLEKEAYERWVRLMSPELSDGVIVDEVGRSPWYIKRYDAWTNAARRVAKQFPQKSFTFFCVTPYFSAFDVMLRAAADGPGNLFLAPEHYYGETQKRGLMHSWSAGNFTQWKRHFPNIAGKTILYLSVGNAATYAGYDWAPDIDYKAFLDDYVKYFVADEQAFEGVCGIGFWKINLCDEELYRYLSALLRHYCLLGCKDRFYTAPLRPGIVENGGFERGSLAGWRVTGDAKARAKVVTLPFIRRVDWKRFPEGEKAVELPRGATLSQTLKALRPGRVYSAECYSMITSKEPLWKKLDVRLDLAGAEIVRRETRVSHDWRRTRSDPPGKVNVCWNQHYVLFRPRSEKVVLRIGRGDAVGSAEEQVLVDFVQVQPYFCGPVYFASESPLSSLGAPPCKTRR